MSLDKKWRPPRKRPRRGSLLFMPAWVQRLSVVVVLLAILGYGVSRLLPAINILLLEAAPLGARTPQAVPAVSGTPTAEDIVAAVRPTNTRPSVPTDLPQITSTTPPTPTRMPPTVTAAITATAQVTVLSTSGLSQTVSAGALTIGGAARIANTGGARINMRRQPSRLAPIIRSMTEGMTLTVVAGPTTADGFIWWSVKDDLQQTGWIAADYLAPNP